jgi:hypothetical protein
MERLGRPAILLPAALRRVCETEAVIALAGPTAEDVAVTTIEGGCYIDEHSPDHARAEELVTTLVEGGLTNEETVDVAGGGDVVRTGGSGRPRDQG